MRSCPLICSTLFSILCLSLAGGGIADDETERDDVGMFMQAKLGHTYKLVEGLAKEDFDLMSKHSQELSLLSLATAWQVLQTPEYAQRSVEFRRSVNALTESAREKNLDGCALAFVDVSLKCVECHKYVRRTRANRVDSGARVPDKK